MRNGKGMVFGHVYVLQRHDWDIDDTRPEEEKRI